MCYSLTHIYYPSSSLRVRFIVTLSSDFHHSNTSIGVCVRIYNCRIRYTTSLVTSDKYRFSSTQSEAVRVSCGGVVSTEAERKF